MIVRNNYSNLLMIFYLQTTCLFESEWPIQESPLSDNAVKEQKTVNTVTISIGFGANSIDEQNRLNFISTQICSKLGDAIRRLLQKK